MGFRRFDSDIASYTQIDMWETYQHVTNLISHPNITKIQEMMTNDIHIPNTAMMYLDMTKEKLETLSTRHGYCAMGSNI